jgi:cyclase
VIDYAAGGSALEWLQTLDAVLKLEWDVAIPGHGQPVKRQALVDYRSSLQSFIDRAREAVRSGAAKDQLMSRLNTDDPGWQVQFTGENLDRFYTEMSR